MIPQPAELFDHIRAIDLPWLRSSYSSGALSWAEEHVGAEHYAELGRRVAAGDVEWIHHLFLGLDGVDKLAADAAATVEAAAAPAKAKRRQRIITFAVIVLAVVGIAALFLIKAVA